MLEFKKLIHEFYYKTQNYCKMELKKWIFLKVVKVKSDSNKYLHFFSLAPWDDGLSDILIRLVN